MAKLRLSIEDLLVDSFTTHARQMDTLAGTVEAHAKSAPFLTCVGDTCNQATCAATECNISACIASCGETCRITCRNCISFDVCA